MTVAEGDDSPEGFFDGFGMFEEAGFFLEFLLLAILKVGGL